MSDISHISDDKFNKIHYNDYTPPTLKDSLNELEKELEIFKKGQYVQDPGDDLDATRKAGFYLDWAVRFRKLFSFSFLGQKGVIAIPNTTFEEWLYWFHELFSKFIDDYNQFKKLTFEAIDGLQKEIDDIKRELEKIENEINQILDMIKTLRDALNALDDKVERYHTELNNKINDLDSKVERYHTDLQNQLNDLKSIVQADHDLLQKIVNNLKDSGAFNGNTFNGHIAYGNINLFSKGQDTNTFIRTNSGHSEGDVAVGV